MKIKKFIAPSMQEAIKLIKKEFGEDAIILNNKSVEHPEWKNAVEITAAIEKKDDLKVEKESFNDLVQKNISQTSTPNSIIGNNLQNQMNNLQKDIHYVRERLDYLIDQIKFDHLPHLPRKLQELIKVLTTYGVKPNIAIKLVEDIFTSLKGEELLEEDKVHSHLITKIKHQIQITGPIKFNQGASTVVLIMGPTGSGKTTTIAKLAALYKYTYSRKVALISIDSYRIAAMDQLKSFGEIAKIPFLPVYDSNDLTEKINSLKKYELILIDTTGINPRNMKQMVSLKEIIRIAKTDEIHLTLSVTTKYSDLTETLKNFAMIPYHGIILTKMDETSCPGDILNIASDFEKPYSYLTFGQDIPEDISLANRNELTQIILRGKHGN